VEYRPSAVGFQIAGKDLMTMNIIASALGQISFLNIVWIFFAGFIVHELEEWNIDRFEHEHFEGISPAATDRSARLWILFISLVGLVWCTVATLPGSPASAAWIILPAVAVMLQNALQHVIWTVYFRQYAPGVISAALLLIPSGSYLFARALQQDYIPVWYAIIWAAFVIIGFAQTVRAGNKMTPLIRAINNLGIWLSNRIG
jgi:hypothetical protein